MAQSLLAKFESAGQGQVFKFWDHLNGPERDVLLQQAGEIDLGAIDSLARTLLGPDEGERFRDYSGLEPAPYISHPAQGGNPQAWKEATAVGEEALRSGRVAALVVAGGQGTRLGFDKPKGMLPITPIRKKSLFQVFAEKIKAVENHYRIGLPWFIMTSPNNHIDTKRYFQENDHFGLSEERVHFFRQGRLPALGFDGKILLSGRASIAMSPDGHGGSLPSFVRSGATRLMKQSGIDLLSYFQVDNPLCKVIDPAFIGFHIQGGANISSKMVPKAYAEEKMGVFCQQNDKMIVIEYSDLPRNLTHAIDDRGNLRFLAGNIANHLLSLKFIEKIGVSSPSIAGLPYHRARKRIPALDEDGNAFLPDAPNGVKFERFVFDALPFAEKSLLLEARRASDFSPVKNGQGMDSPKTAAEDQMKEFASWLEAAGESVTKAEDGVPLQPIEIGPLFGYDEATFLRSWKCLAQKPDLTQPLYLTSEHLPYNEPQSIPPSLGRGRKITPIHCQ